MLIVGTIHELSLRMIHILPPIVVAYHYTPLRPEQQREMNKGLQPLVQMLFWGTQFHFVERDGKSKHVSIANDTKIKNIKDERGNLLEFGIIHTLVIQLGRDLLLGMPDKHQNQLLI